MRTVDVPDEKIRDRPKIRLTLMLLKAIPHRVGLSNVSYRPIRSTSLLD
jgi:hypothetical protein